MAECILRHRILGAAAHFCSDLIKIQKILQHQKYLGIKRYHMDNILDGIREINLGGLLRYGNPDIHFLATLKNEIHIYDILGFLMMNLTSDLNLDSLIYFLM